MKQQFIEAVRAERQALLSAVEGVAHATLSTVPVYGTWTAKDVLAHLAAIDVACLGALRQSVKGEDVTWPWESYPDGDSYNAAEVAKRRDRSFSQVRAELERTHRVLLTELEKLPDSWNEDDSPIGWLPSHDQEHAEPLHAIRSATR